MPPTSSKQPPLPLAPNRASIANEISLLLSRRSALLKTLNPTSSTSTSTSNSASKRHTAANADAIEQLFSGPRPNQGVGYVPEKSDSATSSSQQDGMLRRKLLGKNLHRRGAGKGGKAAESESDEDEGRSALGKRKRKRPVREEEEEEEVAVGEGEDGIGDGDGDVDVLGRGGAVGEEEEGKHDEVDEEGGRIHDKGDDIAPVTETTAISDNAADEAKRNKKKKKRQREKEKQRQKREQK